MTLDDHTKQVAAVGLAYAVGPCFLHDLHCLLEQLTGDEPGPALKVARAHAKTLLKESEPQMH